MARFNGRASAGVEQWSLVRFEVPPGTGRITVTADYERFSTLGLARSVLDLGLVGPDGEFRGWSGGARTTFTVSPADATPGYLAGPLTPGTWAVALGPVVFQAAGMPWSLEIDLEPGPPGPQFRPCPPSPAIEGTGPGWYRGDLHVHTEHSDGRRTQPELLRDAQASGLDLLGSAEHNTNSANRLWGGCTPPGFLVLPGEEVTTRHGHWLAVGLPPEVCVDWRSRPGDGSFPRHVDEVHALGGAVVAAHPLLPLPGTFWQFGFDRLDALEVWNGPWTLDDHFAVELWDSLLRSGRRVTAVGNSDAHKSTDVVGLPQTAYHAEHLSAGAIVAALKHGRCYLAESAGVRLTFDAALPGDTLTTPCDVTILAEGVPGTVLTLHTARGLVAARHVPRSGRASLTWHASDPADLFVRAESRRHVATSTTFSQMAAMTNPLWLT